MSNPSLISTEKIIERLPYENPWWVNKQIPEMYRSVRLQTNLKCTTLYHLLE